MKFFLLIGQCVSTSKNYTIFYNIYNTTISGLIIPISMIVFTLLCIKNVKQLRNRVHAIPQILSIQSTNHRDPRQNIVNKKTSVYQLIFMVLIQQFVYLITNLPYI